MYRLLKIWLFLLLFFLPTRTFAEFFTIKNYSVDITVTKDSVLQIKEDITVIFSQQRHGILRKIPYIYELAKGSGESAERPFLLGNKYRYDIFDIEVPNEKVKVYKEGKYVVIRIGEPDKYVDGEKKYTIYYKVYGAINFFKNHSELYWNVIGTEWDVPIEHAEAYIFFPMQISISDDDIFVYTGIYGSKETKADYNFDGKMLSIRANETLLPRQGITVGVKLPRGYLTKGGIFLNLWLFLINNSVFFIPGLVFIVFFTIWWLIGRDDDYVKMVYYKPPENIIPAEVGVICDDTIDNKDLISLIFYWAANGNLQIAEVEDQTAIIFKKKDYILTKLKDLPDNAKPYEKVMFTGFFPFPDINNCRVSTLKNQFYETMNIARSYLDQEIESLQLYTSSRTYGKLFRGLAIIFAFISFIVGVSLKRLDYFLSLIISSVIIFFFARIMPKKTRHGTEIYKQIEGFKEFIIRVEKTRLNMLLKEDPSYFDKTLPYAIALGVADKWAEKFEGLLKEPPSWYVGYNYDRFSTVAFVNSINSSISDMNAAFTSAPSSAGSGDSGFSDGGGFSGGGGGGGGGSSW